jgi:DNA-binding transcriptional MocR family regulator
MRQLGEEGEFRQYLARIRVEYKRKRNFMKLLEKFGD